MCSIRLQGHPHPHRLQDHRHRPSRTDHLTHGGSAEERFGFAKIALAHRQSTRQPAAQPGPQMAEHQRVRVSMQHSGSRLLRLDHPATAQSAGPHRGPATPEPLPRARDAYRPLHEPTPSQRRPPDHRHRGGQPFGCRPIDRQCVLPAEQVIGDPDWAARSPTLSREPRNSPGQRRTSPRPSDELWAMPGWSARRSRRPHRRYRAGKVTLVHPHAASGVRTARGRSWGTR
jgi:hypothetical protein